MATAAAALRKGAFDYISKPLRQDTLLRVARQALHHRAVVEERARVLARLGEHFDEFMLTWETELNHFMATGDRLTEN